MEEKEERERERRRQAEEGWREEKVLKKGVEDRLREE